MPPIAFEAETKLEATDMDTSILQMAEWLERQIRDAESRDPTLANLKERVRVASEAVRVAEGDATKPALAAQSEAIWALFDHPSVRSK